MTPKRPVRVRFGGIRQRSLRWISQRRQTHIETREAPCGEKRVRTGEKMFTLSYESRVRLAGKQKAAFYTGIVGAFLGMCGRDDSILALRPGFSQRFRPNRGAADAQNLTETAGAHRIKA